MNHYPHHIGDFNNGTRHLTRIERSIYRDLIELYYDTEAPLTSDIDALARRIIARSEEERIALVAVLEEFFTLDAGAYTHSRCDEELAKYQAFAENGKQGAAKRWKRPPDSPPINSPLAKNSPPIISPIATRTNNHKPITNISPLPPKGVEEEEVMVEVSPRIEKTAEKTAVRGGDIAEHQKRVLAVSSTQETTSGNRIDQRFSEFWKAYPENRRKNLYRAQSAFSASIHAMPAQDDLIRSLEAFKQSKEWRQDNGKFIPSPETWIAEHRWQDAPAFSPTAKPKPKSDIDEADAFRWRKEQYPESLDIHPTAATFPFAKWPDSIRAEYRNSKKPQLQAS